MNNGINQSVQQLIDLMEQNHGNIFGIMEHASKGEVFILKYLSLNPEGVYPKQLSETFGGSAARVSAILDSLERKGQVLRETDPQNRRRVVVYPTQDGLARAQRIYELTIAYARRVFEALGEEDALAFVRIATRMADLTQDICAKITFD